MTSLRHVGVNSLGGLWFPWMSRRGTGQTSLWSTATKLVLIRLRGGPSGDMNASRRSGRVNAWPLRCLLALRRQRADFRWRPSIEVVVGVCKGQDLPRALDLVQLERDQPAMTRLAVRVEQMIGGDDRQPIAAQTDHDFAQRMVPIIRLEVLRGCQQLGAINCVNLPVSRLALQRGQAEIGMQHRLAA